MYLEFFAERLKRYLRDHPENAAEIALTYFEDFSVLASRHKQLKKDFTVLQLQNIKLQSQLKLLQSPQYPHQNKNA